MTRAEILESRNKTDWNPLVGSAGVGSSPVTRLAGVQHEVAMESGGVDILDLREQEQGVWQGSEEG